MIEKEIFKKFEPEIEQVDLRSRPSVRRAMVRRAKFELTERDLNVLRFLLEMKFSDLDSLHALFFRITKDGSLSASTYWARERLWQLEKEEFIKRQTLFVEKRVWFLATQKAASLLQVSMPIEQRLRALREVDIRFFHHDRFVLSARRDLETLNSKCKWISDRLLRSGRSKDFGLASVFIPDGIYENEKGELIFFELELSSKKRRVYQEKIKYFVKLMREGRQGSNSPTQIHYRCIREPVFKTIRELTSIYGELFKVELVKVHVPINKENKSASR